MLSGLRSAGLLLGPLLAGKFKGAKRNASVYAAYMQGSCKVLSTRITISDDFDLEKIANSGQCFRVRKFSDGTYRFITHSNVCYIKQTSRNAYNVSCPAKVWENVWRTYFNLERNYCEVRAKIPDSDVFLRNAAKEGCGIRILVQDTWEMLITFIISQRKAIPAIHKSVELLCKCWGTQITTPHETVHAFPTPKQMQNATLEQLKECKLGYRAAYVQDAVHTVCAGNLNLEDLRSLNDAELVSALKSVKGVGNKVANCISLFAYGRISLASVDTWIQKIIDVHYGGENHFLEYGNVAGIMQQYAFWWAQTHKSEFR